MVRQIMIDLEAKDLCDIEKASLQREITNYEQLVVIREKECQNAYGQLDDARAQIKEKNKQIALKNSEIEVLKKDLGSKAKTAFLLGAGTGALSVALLTLLLL